MRLNGKKGEELRLTEVLSGSLLTSTDPHTLIASLLSFCMTNYSLS